MKKIKSFILLVALEGFLYHFVGFDAAVLLLGCIWIMQQTDVDEKA